MTVAHYGSQIILPHHVSSSSSSTIPLPVYPLHIPKGTHKQDILYDIEVVIIVIRQQKGSPILVTITMESKKRVSLHQSNHHVLCGKVIQKLCYITLANYNLNHIGILIQGLLQKKNWTKVVAFVPTSPMDCFWIVPIHQCK